MSDLNQRCLEAFPSWLRSLPNDARLFATVIGQAEFSYETRVALAGALNYLLKSVDLIADGIEDLGYLDDAFVLRVAAVRREMGAPVGEEGLAELEQLAKDAELIRELLGSEFELLANTVTELAELSVRGRTPGQIVDDPDTRSEFLSDVFAWANSYETPTFENDPKTMVKLQAYLKAKLAGSVPKQRVPE